MFLVDVDAQPVGLASPREIVSHGNLLAGWMR
jgi:hypothetical protein